MTARRPMRVGIIGAGVMAEAMISGLLANRAVTPDLLAASHPRRERRDVLAERHGIHPVTAMRSGTRRSWCWP
jgi:pyrroline-5-carboxylate reductase